MTFPTAAAMITRRKSLGTSTGPAAIAIAIYFLPIAWLYRFIASRHADVLDRPAANASSPVATVLELKSTVLQRPVSRRRPPRVGLETMTKGIIAPRATSLDLRLGP